MTVTADRNRSVHFFSGKAFFEPLVAVAPSWNQVVLSRSRFQDATAQLARLVTAIDFDCVVSRHDTGFGGT
ncbi:MAG: hypothetical protein AAF539_11470 [Planctomycetota bacterium]